MTNNESKPSTFVNSNFFSASSSFCEYPPKLTDEECCLLMDHAGCLKCCKFYAGHRVHQCTITISGRNYKTLIVQDAQHAKAFQSGKNANNSQNNPVVTITDANTSQNKWKISLLPFFLLYCLLL